MAEETAQTATAESTDDTTDAEVAAEEAAAEEAAAEEAAAEEAAAEQAAAKDSTAVGRPLGAGIISLIGLLWLAATMWSAHGAIARNVDDPAVLVGSAALALPVVVLATLLAGAAAGLAAASRFALDRSAARRLTVGLAGGAACGALPGVAIMITYGVTPPVALLALTVLAAGALGGAGAALPLSTLAAGVAGTLAVFVTRVLLNLFWSPLKSLFGAGSTVESQYEAANLLSRAGALASGLAAGMVAYAYLRRRKPGARWPAYLCAGASAGVLLLLAEALTVAGGAGLLELVSGLSEADRLALGYLDSERLVQALIVAFTGGIVAMIAVGRTLRREDEPAESADPAGSDAEPAP